MRTGLSQLYPWAGRRWDRSRFSELGSLYADRHRCALEAGGLTSGRSTPPTSHRCRASPSQDKLDAVWLCQQREAGMRWPSFHPPIEISGATPSVSPLGRGPGPQEVQGEGGEATGERAHQAAEPADGIGAVGRVMEALFAGERAPWPWRCWPGGGCGAGGQVAGSSSPAASTSTALPRRQSWKGQALPQSRPASRQRGKVHTFRAECPAGMVKRSGKQMALVAVADRPWSWSGTFWPPRPPVTVTWPASLPPRSIASASSLPTVMPTPAAAATPPSTTRRGEDFRGRPADGRPGLRRCGRASSARTRGDRVPRRR